MKVIQNNNGVTPVLELTGLTPLEALIALQSLKANTLKSTTLEIQTVVLEAFKAELLKSGKDTMEIKPSGTDFTNIFKYEKGTKDTRKKAIDELVEMGILTKVYSTVYQLNAEYVTLFKNGFDSITLFNSKLYNSSQYGNVAITQATAQTQTQPTVQTVAPATVQPKAKKTSKTRPKRTEEDEKNIVREHLIDGLKYDELMKKHTIGKATLSAIVKKYKEEILKEKGE